MDSSVCTRMWCMQILEKRFKIYFRFVIVRNIISGIYFIRSNYPEQPITIKEMKHILLQNVLSENKCRISVDCMYICPLWISGFDWLNLFREKQRNNTYNYIEKYKDSTEKGSSYFHHVHLWGVSNLCYRIEKQVKNLGYKNKN